MRDYLIAASVFGLQALGGKEDVVVISSGAKRTSRRIVIPNHTDILRRMLRQYPNLTLDLSWVIFEQEIAPGGALDKRWASLIEEYPNRFVIGSDTVGFFDTYKQTLQRYYVLLDALKPETAHKVARDNFLALLPRPVAERH